MAQEPGSSSCCGGGPCGPLDRRGFLVASGLGAAGALIGGSRAAVAGPFTAPELQDLIPADKKLAPEWVRSLYERGEPTTYSGAELHTIGMPVGGIACGQLYLGGDGRLWHWDVFSSRFRPEFSGDTRGPHYASPMEPRSPLEQGFALRAGGMTRTLDAAGFADVTFTWRWPIGLVRYRDPECPVEVELEAFSPFVPLDEDDSSLPATVMRFALRNAGDAAVDVELAGWMQNAVCPGIESPSLGVRRTLVKRRPGRTTLSATVEGRPAPEGERRPPVLFADFEEPAWHGWTSEGTAFGDRPRRLDDIAAYQGDLNAHGQGLVDTHETRHGEDVREADRHVGTLTSDPFTISRRWIRFRIGGGRHPGRTGMELLVDGEVVRSATGHDANRMRSDAFDVADLEGREARLRIVDREQGPWGNVGIDEIVFSDDPPPASELEELGGYGSMALSLLDPAGGDAAVASIGEGAGAEAVLDALAAGGAESAEVPLGRRTVGALGRKLSLAPGERAEAVFLVTWWFPQYEAEGAEFGPLDDLHPLRRRYGGRFASASEVAGHVARHFERLAGKTRLWCGTWYDSTLPYWFLDRTIVTADCLATQTCHAFDNGRFWGWEGVDCCAGTCQHVWQYAQAVARLFPRLERTTCASGWTSASPGTENGAMDFRAESARSVAARRPVRHDPARLSRAPDGARRRVPEARVWPRIKRVDRVHHARDADGDGLLEGEQKNTLDTGLVRPDGLDQLAVPRGGRGAARRWPTRWATPRSPRRCRARSSRPAEEPRREALQRRVLHPQADPITPRQQHQQRLPHRPGARPELGLPGGLAARSCPREETRSALRSLWRYNFTPDVGPYREKFKTIRGGRWYAMPGEGGLLVVHLPARRRGQGRGQGRTRVRLLLQRVLDGFEYQVAAHMIWEGMVDRGAGDRADDPRPLPRRAPQPVQRGRVLRPLRARDGQLRRLPRRLRLRVPRAEGAPRLRAAAHARGLPRRVHGRRGLGAAAAGAPRRAPGRGDRAAAREPAARDARLRAARGRAREGRRGRWAPARDVPSGRCAGRGRARGARAARGRPAPARRDHLGNLTKERMVEIEVQRSGPDTFRVEVREGSGSTVHRVTAGADALRRYGGADDPEALIEASFEFLLEREPKESILRAFELGVIERYFPEYPRRIRARGR